MTKTEASRMFPFIKGPDKGTCNPLGGRCPHDCLYCWSMGYSGLVNRFQMKKYAGAPRLYPGEVNRIKSFRDGDFIFIQDMSDLFAEAVPTRFILEVLDAIRCSSAKFLLMTKNPTRYYRFIDYEEFPENVVLGCTIESNKGAYYFSTPADLSYYTDISKAPPLALRLDAMLNIRRETDLPLFISIEPILNFNGHFAEALKLCRPWAVAVGYDNYGYKLPEPTLASTMQLIRELEGFTTVYRKTLRPAWYEKQLEAF